MSIRLPHPIRCSYVPAMQIVKSVSAMQSLALEWKRAGVKIGFVPTMGYLHLGHMSLVAAARRAVGPQGKVVVSIYVNPTQFAANEDLSRYPRDFPRDCQMCEAAGVDAVFAPTDQQMYPAGVGQRFSTFVQEEVLSRSMEGAARPAHFRGVTTVVAKLFNIVQPDVAVFGAKDYQQAVVIKRMVRDLNFPIRIIVAPTRRESDGLAMSSRNKYLGPDLRLQAKVLSLAIAEARVGVRKAPGGIPARLLRASLEKFISAAPDARVDYIAFFDPETLEPVEQVRRGSHMALAVYIGKTRLIDNYRL
jgi:pantoate--beta-alanine ligase